MGMKRSAAGMNIIGVKKKRTISAKRRNELARMYPARDVFPR